MTITFQQKTLAILPKFTGFLSLLGSSFIFGDIVQMPVTTVYHRLILGLSISDIVASIVNVLSTWPVPAETTDVFLASGTTQTCTAQGFFNELGNVSTPLYNASLAIYYILIIRSGWAEDQVRSRAEPALHFLPLATSFVMAALGLPFHLYNDAGWFCWVAPLPKGCLENDGGLECARGANAETFLWVHYGIIWSAILFVTWGMYSIYRTVKMQEMVVAGHPRDAGGQMDLTQRKLNTKKVAIQAGLFVGALYLTWIFTTIARIYQITNGRNNYPLLILMAIFFPLQGFFNAFIYIRPRYLGFRAQYPYKTKSEVFLMALFPNKCTMGAGGGNSSSSANNNSTPPRQVEVSQKHIRDDSIGEKLDEFVDSEAQSGSGSRDRGSNSPEQMA